MKTAVLSLGTNIGERSDNLKTATLFLNEEVGRVVKNSSVIETESWGFDSAPFLNQAIVIETDLAPLDLLNAIKTIERKMGRETKTAVNPETGKPEYSDRIIDIDILLYGSSIISHPELTVPHPLISKRAFVLQPLTELFGNEVIAPFELSFNSMLEKLNHYGDKI